MTTVEDDIENEEKEQEKFLRNDDWDNSFDRTRFPGEYFKTLESIIRQLIKNVKELQNERTGKEN